MKRLVVEKNFKWSGPKCSAKWWKNVKNHWILVFEVINSHSTTKTNIWNGFYCSFFAFLIIDVDYVLRHIFYSLAINSMTSFTFSYYEWNILHINWHFWKISQGKSLHDIFKCRINGFIVIGQFISLATYDGPNMVKVTF